MSTPLGPIELIVIGFPENRFTGEISDALMDLVDRGLVRIIDLAVVIKDAAGEVTVLELREFSEEVAEAMVALTGDLVGMLSEADLIELAETLEPDSTVAALLFEHVWATTFAEAVRSAGGGLLMAQRIPHDIVEATRETLVAAAQARG
jgi:uncharacterized membrane protein